MKSEFSFPPLREGVPTIVASVIYMLLTARFIGIRPEHYVLLGIFLVAFFVHKKSRKFIVGLLPFIVFGISYDWMRVYPNYLANAIDVEGLYSLEKSLFGINGMIPSEYFAVHNCAFADILSGIFYLAWVPIPIMFAIYLYVNKRRAIFLRFSVVFLFVNFIGFVIYYIHPAAPPWYVMTHGFDVVINTSGTTAGLSRFDGIIGIPLFASIYDRNANVFAAVPSLHSAYLVVALFYAVKNHCHFVISGVIALFMCGIWFTAVYTAHHYIIDVLLGILCAISGIFLFECGLMKLSVFRKLFDSYSDYIK